MSEDPARIAPTTSRFSDPDAARGRAEEFGRVG